MERFGARRFNARDVTRGDDEVKSSVNGLILFHFLNPSYIFYNDDLISHDKMVFFFSFFDLHAFTLVISRQARVLKFIMFHLHNV